MEAHSSWASAAADTDISRWQVFKHMHLLIILTFPPLELTFAEDSGVFDPNYPVQEIHI